MIVGLFITEDGNIISIRRFADVSSPWILNFEDLSCFVITKTNLDAKWLIDISESYNSQNCNNVKNILNILKFPNLVESLVNWQIVVKSKNWMSMKLSTELVKFETVTNCYFRIIMIYNLFPNLSCSKSQRNETHCHPYDSKKTNFNGWLHQNAIWMNNTAYSRRSHRPFCGLKPYFEAFIVVLNQHEFMKYLAVNEIIMPVGMLEVSSYTFPN